MNTQTSGYRSYAFVRRPAWIFLHIAVVVTVSLFALAGFWQLDRLNERQARNEQIRDALAKPPVSLSDGIPPLFRRAVAEGRFDVANEIIVRNRSQEGRAGNHVLTPFVYDDGLAVVVDRGWVPAELDDPPVKEAAPPRGEVEIRGVLYPGESKRPLAPDDPPADRLEAFNRINIERIRSQLPYRSPDRYLLLDDQDPEQSGDLPKLVPPADLSAGSHGAYAVQWFLFIPSALAVYIALLRRESRKRIDEPSVPV